MYFTIIVCGFWYAVGSFTVFTGSSILEQGKIILNDSVSLLTRRKMIIPT